MTTINEYLNRDISQGDALAIRYAENRAELRAVNKELAGIDQDAFNAIHLDAEDWREAQKENMPGDFEQWEGWVHLVDNSDDYDVDQSSDVYRIAKLWDERKKLGNALGKIRRAVSAHGAKLLRRKS